MDDDKPAGRHTIRTKPPMTNFAVPTLAELDRLRRERMVKRSLAAVTAYMEANRNVR